MQCSWTMAHKKVSKRTGKYLRFLNRKGLAIALHMLRCQWFAVCLYSYTIDVLHLQHTCQLQNMG